MFYDLLFLALNWLICILRQMHNIFNYVILKYCINWFVQQFLNTKSRLEVHPSHSTSHDSDVFKMLLKAVKCDTFEEYAKNLIFTYKRHIQHP